jgi:hypothetical protein
MSLREKKQTFITVQKSGQNIFGVAVYTGRLVFTLSGNRNGPACMFYM